MDLTEIAHLRLANQQITATHLTTVKEIVAHMGAMQAQDFAMVKWAVGVRLPGSTETLVETAISRGEILRTHLLRPTWHFVSADDIYWMLRLTAPNIKRSAGPRLRDLGLSDEMLALSSRIIERLLRDGKQASRETLAAEFEKAGISTTENRLSHILINAELDGLVCSGATVDGKITYALLEERVPGKKLLSREESLATLAQRYFTSHGPASLQDFIWWSGLPVGAGRQALELVKANFNAETIGSQTYWFAQPSAPASRGSVHLLPAYDEFTISYTDRSASLANQHFARAISINGIFHPILVVDGQVTGLWKRSIKKGIVNLEIEPLAEIPPTIQPLIAQAARQFARFLGKELNKE